MGKDNLVFHTIFWPGQLMVFDDKLHLPDYPAINQYLNLEGKKFSKSRGVVVDTAEFIKEYGAEPLRFYLTSIMPENSDSNFSEEDFYKKNNGLLVGHIGNYVHRTLTLYEDISISSKISKSVLNEISKSLGNSITNLKESKFKAYFEEIESLSKYANVLFNENKPWITKKEDKKKFESSMVDLVILTYALMCLMEPITPNAASLYLSIIGLNKNELWANYDNIEEFLNEIINKVNIKSPKHLFKKLVELEEVVNINNNEITNR